MKKIILTIKILIILIVSYLMIVLWNLIDVNQILKESTNLEIMILKPIYIVGKIILISALLGGTIYVLFKKRNKKIKKVEPKEIPDKIGTCYKMKKDSDSNMIKYYYRSNGLTLNDYKKFENELELSLNAKIGAITYGDDTKDIIVYATPYKDLEPEKYSLSNGDKLFGYIINLLVVGATGTGKTYFINLLLANLLLLKSECKLYLCDFKNYDFSQFKDCKRYYGYIKAVDGIKEVYQIFQDRLLSNELNMYPIILCIDEYASLISSLGKEASEIQAMISEILFMGRSYNIIPIIGMQRADSTYFKNGSRDQFKTIFALGNLSPEQKSMLFNDFKDSMNDTNSRGEGYLYQDGKQFLQRIRVSQINDNERVIIDSTIRQGLNR